MEVNEGIMSDAPDAYTTPDATVIQGSNENKHLSQDIEIACPGEVGVEKKQFIKCRSTQRDKRKCHQTFGYKAGGASDCTK